MPGSLISSISSTERGEVFYGPTDWLGSRDPMTPDDSQAHHAYCTIRWMTDPLQTGLATSSEIISHTRFDPVYIRLHTDS
jgi:hypothetical protein